MRHIPSRDRGASAVEYGLLVAAIAAVIVGTVFALGGALRTAFEHTCTAIASTDLASEQCGGPQQPNTVPTTDTPPAGA